ncbi:hypothetical protein [Streptomyces sp. NPDC055709]
MTNSPWFLEPSSTLRMARQQLSRLHADISDAGFTTAQARIRPSVGLLSRYDFVRRRLYIGVHDPEVPESRLLCGYLAGLSGLEEPLLLELISLLLPCTVAHEYAHHLRHTVGRTGPTPWHEEQAAHALVAAWPSCMEREQKNRACGLLEAALAGLLQHSGCGPEDYLLSYAFCPADCSSPAVATRRSKVIHRFNTQVAPPDYLYLQFGWTLATLRSPTQFNLRQWLSDHIGQRQV